MGHCRCSVSHGPMGWRSTGHERRSPFSEPTRGSFAVLKNTGSCSLLQETSRITVDAARDGNPIVGNLTIVDDGRSVQDRIAGAIYGLVAPLNHESPVSGVRRCQPPSPKYDLAEPRSFLSALQSPALIGTPQSLFVQPGPPNPTSDLSAWPVRPWWNKDANRFST